MLVVFERGPSTVIEKLRTAQQESVEITVQYFRCLVDGVFSIRLFSCVSDFGICMLKCWQLELWVQNKWQTSTTTATFAKIVRNYGDHLCWNVDDELHLYYNIWTNLHASLYMYCNCVVWCVSIKYWSLQAAKLTVRYRPTMHAVFQAQRNRCCPIVVFVHEQRFLAWSFTKVFIIINNETTSIHVRTTGLLCNYSQMPVLVLY